MQQRLFKLTSKQTLFFSCN